MIGALSVLCHHQECSSGDPNENAALKYCSTRLFKTRLGSAPFDSGAAASSHHTTTFIASQSRLSENHKRHESRAGAKCCMSPATEICSSIATLPALESFKRQMARPKAIAAICEISSSGECTSSKSLSMSQCQSAPCCSIS